jgi:uncharacterized membrane protein YbjE (DUF340 family)
VEFDPFLYVALAAGWLAGRLVPLPDPWVRRATFATVIVLIGFLGATLHGVGLPALGREVPGALAFVALVLGLTAAAYWLLSRGRLPGRTTGAPVAPRTWSTSVALLAALGAGFALGGLVTIPAEAGLTLTLYVLLLLVGLSIRFERTGLARAWVPIASAAVGALGASVVYFAVTRLALGASLAVGLAFGWYSLAGPLVSARDGPAIGLLAFLVNFLREILTMLLAPRLGPRLGGPGLAALGGATAMDTTLPFVLRYGSEESASLALTSGLVLTVAAGLLLPGLLAV